MNFEEITINEADFYAKQTTLIEIIPNFYEDSLAFISGEYGPFKPNKPVEIPLWLGIYLKQRNLCRIIPPDYLNCESLALILEEEKNQKENLSSLLSTSPYYFEICHTLLRHAADDLTNSSKIRDLLEDIETIREAKIHENLNKINKDSSYLQANNMTFYEINKRRKVFCEIMKQAHIIKTKSQQDDGNNNNPSLFNTQYSQNSSQF